MGALNSYEGMAYNDYQYAKDGLSTGDRLGNYNNVASGCAQAAEKYLKAILVNGWDSTDEVLKLLRSHNLRAIYNEIIKKYSITISSRDCKWLGDFYFDARYPGDYFIEVNRQDAEECLNLVESLAKDAERILQEINANKKISTDTLKELKAFKD